MCSVMGSSSAQEPTRCQQQLLCEQTESTLATQQTECTMDAEEYSVGKVKYLHGNLMRNQNRRNPMLYYKPIKSLGKGSMGCVVMVKKRESVRGGSARPTFCREHQEPPRFWHRLFPALRPTNNYGSSFGSSSSYVEKNKCFQRAALSFCSPRSFSMEEDDDDDSVWGGSSRKRPYFRVHRKQNFLAFDLDEKGLMEPTLVRPPSASSIISYERKETRYALKSIHADRFDPKLLQEIQNEVKILKDLDHPNIVKAYETYYFRHRIFLVLEMCHGGDLYTRDPYTEQEALSIMKSLISAVAYMHSKNVMHRDIKFENIMFVNEERDSEVKLIDFGLSKKCSTNKTSHEPVGTAYTMAPELIRGRYSAKADVWSLGVVSFMLLSSSLPFYGRTTRQILRSVSKGKYCFSPRYWEHVSEEAKEFVSSLLVVKPASRPTAKEVLLSPWLNSFEEIDCGLDESKMDQVQASIQNFVNYPVLKKLALVVIAHKATNEQIGFLRKTFAKYNHSKNGELTLSEFKLVLEDYKYSHKELEQMFDGISLDGSGVIRYSEFLAATMEAVGSIHEEDVAEAFDHLDGDDTGFITADDIRDFLGYDVSQEYLSQIIEESDVDHDNKISYVEFLGLWNERNDVEMTASLRDVQLRRFRGLDSTMSWDSSSLSGSDTIDSDADSLFRNDAGEKGSRLFYELKQHSLRLKVDGQQTHDQASMQAAFGRHLPPRPPRERKGLCSRA